MNSINKSQDLEPAVSEAYVEKLRRAEKIFKEKYQERFAREFAGKIVAIDIVSERAFIADGVVEALRKAHDGNAADPIFVKAVGTTDPFIGYSQSSAEDALKAFMNGEIRAYSIKHRAQAPLTPGLLRKVDKHKFSIVLWSRREGAEDFLSKHSSDAFEVVELSHSDVEKFIQSRGEMSKHLTIEMLPWREG